MNHEISEWSDDALAVLAGDPYIVPPIDTEIGRVVPSRVLPADLAVAGILAFNSKRLRILLSTNDAPACGGTLNIYEGQDEAGTGRVLVLSAITSSFNLPRDYFAVQRYVFIELVNGAVAITSGQIKVTTRD
jgi:hypothetical protein